MWQIFALCSGTSAGYAIGSNYGEPLIGTGIGFLVGLVLAFPQIIGGVLDAAADCID